MKTSSYHSWFWLITALAVFSPLELPAQPEPPLSSANASVAQRNAINAVHAEANWLPNAARSAPRYATGNGYGLVFEHFQTFRSAFGAFTSSLSRQQVTAGADQLDDLDEGLGVFQDVFSRYEDDLASGQPAGKALRTLCDALRRGTGPWLREFNRVCNRLGAGRL